MSLYEQREVELKKFVQDIENIVRENKEEKLVTNALVYYLKEKLNYYKDFIPEFFKRPNPDKYVLYPIYIAKDNSFCIASAVWDVGQSTPIHDHGVWGVIGIVQGRECEQQFIVEQRGEEKLITQIGESNLEQGDVKVCCSSEIDIHKVSCISQIPCVGIHIYGGNIGILKRHVYDPDTGDIKSVVTPWDCPPLINEI